MRPRIAVRRYDVGFGDAFLVRLKTAGGERRMLIDCGSIKAGPHAMDDVVTRIIQDVTDDRGARIDVVVATHRHNDHVSGFAHPAWSKVEVGEVWMPWTEHPTNANAKRIRDTQAAMARHLAGSLAPVTAEHQMAINALSQEAAMATLHAGFAGNPVRRFLPRSPRDRGVFETDAYPGAVFHVVGPAFCDETIREIDPPIGQSFVARFGDDGKPRAVAPEPFSESWWEPDGPLTAEQRRDIERAAVGLDGLAVTALESAVNGTSLCFVMQVGESNLVIAGDARGESWKAAMAMPRLAKLLATTTVYKIGHHRCRDAVADMFVTKLDPDCMAIDSPDVVVEQGGLFVEATITT